ncbi:cytochrome b subunit of succinate dehydrogenase, Sdh3p [Malassezia yamatoensis]|uniref:Cytochrome b subunit of succinate dehydrogenase, Sdh3p n=1 Tax=Malassezia yamatoensis TaxID=253288 RepID=A0AAJ5YWS7_9BASI|nr:cytochrome b subunit of succinate dehydrogenase, Sdh3p [Malassezia yamatoensis]
MSLFTASPLLRTSLSSSRGVLGAARCVPVCLALSAQAPRSLSTSPVTRALPWAKSAKTHPVSLDQDFKALNAVRQERPTSPHFTIYQPQLTWLSSIANRVTGVGLSFGLYAFMSAYAVAPLFGWTEALSSAHLTQLAAELPLWAKLGLKVPLAAAASFHTVNGLRHLSWDMGYFLDLKESYIAGYSVIAASAAATIYLCML